jgi:hypothetical protein
MTVEIVNKGTRYANNTKVSIAVPGIVTNPGDFKIHGNYLNRSIASLAVNASVKLRFEFKVPNSETIGGAIVQYNNQTGNRTFTIRANSLYIDAPVDYKTITTKPCVIGVSTSMSLVTPSSIPALNQAFNVSYSATVSNLPAHVKNITFTLAGTPWFSIAGKSSVLISLTSGTGSAQKRFNKTSSKGYLVPPFSLTSNNMSGLMRYVLPQPVQVGQVNVTIQKYMGHRSGNEIIPTSLLSSDFHVTRDGYIDVAITITYTGTLPVGFVDKELPTLRNGFIVSDDYGYNQSGFVFVSGNISRANITLNPGESASFGYRLRASHVGQYTMGSTRKTMFFLRVETVVSNTFTVTIDEKPSLIAAYLATSIGVTVVLVLGSLYNKKKQKRAYEEFKKRDRILYDDIATSKKTYQEYLD